jgi:hypothetical protein
MANSLSIANISGVAAPVSTAAVPNYAGVGGFDRNAVLVYEREKRIRYSVGVFGNYVQHVRGTNVGEVIDLTKPLANAPNSPNQYWGFRGPVRMYVLNPGGVGYAMSIVPGADALHWLLVIYSGIAAELAAGAYPAGLAADTDIVLEATGVAAD